jgi:hypothetical protein
MYKMKNVMKIFALLLAFVMIISMAACGKTDTKPTEPTTEPTTQVTEDPTQPTDDVTEPGDEEVDETILTDTEYRLLALFNEQSVEFPVMTWALTIDDAEMIKSFTGLDDATNIVEASVTEPAMSAQAYSVVLVKVADGVDAATVADSMKSGVNPRKWICVEADEIETVVDGNYVLLVMMSSDLSETVSAKSLTEAYVTLMETYETPSQVAPAPVGGVEVEIDEDITETFDGEIVGEP